MTTTTIKKTAEQIIEKINAETCKHYLTEVAAHGYNNVQQADVSESDDAEIRSAAKNRLEEIENGIDSYEIGIYEHMETGEVYFLNQNGELYIILSPDSSAKKYPQLPENSVTEVLESCKFIEDANGQFLAEQNLPDYIFATIKTKSEKTQALRDPAGTIFAIGEDDIIEFKTTAEDDVSDFVIYAITQDALDIKPVRYSLWRGTCGHATPIFDIYVSPQQYCQLCAILEDGNYPDGVSNETDDKIQALIDSWK